MKPPLSRSRSLGRLISQIARQGRVHLSQQMRPLGLGFGQFQILHTLYHYNCTTQEDIVRQLGTDKSTTARTIKKLVDQGYVVREIDQSNKRAYRISLTQKGTSFERDFRQILSGWTNLLTDGFSEKETDTAFELLGRILSNALSCPDTREDRA